MKKTLIALAVASAAVATGVNASEVYNQDGTTLSVGGRAEARLNVADGEVADNTRVRLNLSGKVAINDNFYGLGFYEAEYTTADTDTTPTNADSLDHRYSYAGFGGAFGELTYGKNDGALGQITDFTDTLNDHSGSASKKLDTADRQDNMLSYKGSFDGISIKAAHRFEDRTVDSTSGEYSNNNYSGSSASIAWAIADSGVSLGAGAATETSTAGADSTQGILAASYTFDGVYLAALYSSTNADVDTDDRKGYELTASYTLEQATYYATYGRSKVDSDNKADTKYLTLEGEYKFKPNFKGYVSYNINMVDEDATTSTTLADTEDDVTLGLRYDF